MLESSERTAKQDTPRSEILQFDVGGDTEPILCELIVWRPVTIRGRVHTAGGRPVEKVRIVLLGLTDSEKWMWAQGAFSSNRGNYRFRGLDPQRRWAVALEGQDQSGWKIVSSAPDEQDEEELTTLTDRRNKTSDPSEFRYFAEVPLLTERPRLDIPVELEDN